MGLQPWLCPSPLLASLATAPKDLWTERVERPINLPAFLDLQSCPKKSGFTIHAPTGHHEACGSNAVSLGVLTL